MSTQDPPSEPAPGNEAPPTAPPEATHPQPSTSIRNRTLIATAIVILLLVGCWLNSQLDGLRPEANPRPECKVIDGERTQGIIFTNPKVARAHPDLYCACLSEAARRTSSTWLLFALLAGVTGGTLNLLGSALGPAPGASPGSIRAARGILLAGLGALIIGFALYCNSRATAASTVAGDAHDALMGLHKEMYARCIHAKSAWMSSRIDSAALVFNKLSPTEPSATPTPRHTE